MGGGVVTKGAAGGGGSGGVLRIVKAAVAAREAGNLACTLVDGAYLTAVLAGDERDVGVWERLHGYVVNRRIPGAVGAAAGAAEVVVLGVVAKDFVSRGMWGWAMLAVNGMVERVEKIGEWKEGRGRG